MRKQTKKPAISPITYPVAIKRFNSCACRVVIPTLLKSELNKAIMPKYFQFGIPCFEPRLGNTAFATKKPNKHAKMLPNGDHRSRLMPACALTTIIRYAAGNK